MNVLKGRIAQRNLVISDTYELRCCCMFVLLVCVYLCRSCFTKKVYDCTVRTGVICALVECRMLGYRMLTILAEHIHNANFEALKSPTHRSSYVRARH